MAATVAAASVLFSSCINDDGIPYPDIKANFKTFVVEHQERAAAIDSVRRHVTVYLNDSADIEQVKVMSYTFSRSDASLVNPEALSKPIDLADTFSVELKVYREYLWTISAVQTVNRLFAVENQVGASVIDVANHTVAAVVSSNQPLNAVKVTEIKLAGATAVMSPDLSGQTVDFTNPVKVAVTEHGESEEWTITVTRTESPVEITAVDAWTGVAWVYASALAGENVTFKYRKLGTLAWTDVDAADVTTEGATYIGRINGLEANTDYETSAFIGDGGCEPVSFTTGAAAKLPNSDFTDWWLDDKVWCPWTKGEESFWETGNKGASTLGQSNVLPIENATSPTGYKGVSLQTKFVGVSVLGKLAAGSVFSGRFVKVDGTNGILAFGRPFTERPTRLRARLKYKTAPISDAIKQFDYMKGQPDTCSVWVALSDRTETYEIRTRPEVRQLFDPEDPSVIAYGVFNSGSDINDYVDIDIPFNYRSTSRVPKQIIVVGSASKYGDYFTGGRGAVLDIESFELLYDY